MTVSVNLELGFKVKSQSNVPHRWARMPIPREPGCRLPRKPCFIDSEKRPKQARSAEQGGQRPVRPPYGPAS